jgi:predicted peroxiredoxin
MPRAQLFVHATPRDASQLEYSFDQVVRLAREGRDVTLFLVEDGVLDARRGPTARPLARALAAGVEVLVDRASLRARGLRGARLLEGTRTAGLDALANRIAAGERATWL